MAISSTRFKKEVINEHATLVDTGDGEKDNIVKAEDGSWSHQGTKAAAVLYFHSDSGAAWEGKLTHSSHMKGGAWAFIQECYGHKAAKKAITFDEDGYAKDPEYFWGLINNLVGQEFDLVIEVGKWTRVKEMTLTGTVELPSKDKLMEARATVSVPKGNEDMDEILDKQFGKSEEDEPDWMKNKPNI